MSASPTVDPGQVSDGYHTFNELYEHRHALVLALMAARPDLFWYSLRHYDGEVCFGGEYFIVGAELPNAGTVSYHLPVSLFNLAVKISPGDCLDKAPEWDGHTAGEVVSRLKKWAGSANVRRGIDHSTRLALTSNMRRYGGNFVEKLADTMSAADPENFGKLCVAFPKIVAKYSEEQG